MVVVCCRVLGVVVMLVLGFRYHLGRQQLRVKGKLFLALCYLLPSRASRV